MFYEIATHGVISVILFCGFLGMPLLGIVAMILELRRKDGVVCGRGRNPTLS